MPVWLHAIIVMSVLAGAAFYLLFGHVMYVLVTDDIVKTPLYRDNWSRGLRRVSNEGPYEYIAIFILFHLLWPPYVFVLLLKQFALESEA